MPCVDVVGDNTKVPGAFCELDRLGTRNADHEGPTKAVQNAEDFICKRGNRYEVALPWK